MVTGKRRDSNPGRKEQRAIKLEQLKKAVASSNSFFMKNWFLVHPEPVRGRQSLTLLKNAKNRIIGAFLAADSGSGSGENAKFYRMKKNCIELISISYFMTRWVLVHPEPARGLQSATAPKNAQNGAFAGCWREGERPKFFFS